MANPILTLNPPFHGLSAIVNVVNRVGPSEVNNSADVRVVQRLIQMAARGSTAGVKIGVPAATGTYDAATGFWIYHVQFVQKRSRPNQVVDGIVSPAHGSSYMQDTHWAIVLLNAMAKDHSATEFASFLSSGGTT
jgi:hypothetical protein